METAIAIAMLLKFSVLKFMGVLQPELVPIFSPNFQGSLSHEDPEMIRFWAYLAIVAVVMATLFKIFHS